MRELEELIREEISEKGPIPFRRFMELALYHPEHGYYSKGPTIGKEGDFFTSSSVGAIFGRTLAYVFTEMLDTADADTIVEMGAGEGTLAKDILDELDLMNKKVNYVIVEKSEGMRNKQRETLKGRAVLWVDDLQELKNVNGVFFSNELVDAFPVHLVKKENGGFYEAYVDWDGSGFVQTWGEPSTDKILEFFSLQEVDLPEGFITEVNLDMLKWLENVSKALQRGFLVTIDYGYNRYEYYHPVRNRGTLMCYYKHQASEDPYQRVGEQDITSHVNFSVLALYGKRLGFEVVGFTNQLNFLIDAGILDMVREQRELLQVKTLLMPGSGMGERFKVLIQQKGLDKKFELRCLKNAPKRKSFEL
ncbi:conserved hypothetical protein [Thermosulfidibacter takaii ABI70S6]|uniref:SAM-dependent methyltransferase n=1 Tax=Thermosulfidibacter takaii (strain DSM 17441 / JCM 13301 / NBRC 103674 / ABI70S6) TaxID=1298851 RepID=A0A0S3QS84_THET7|nr:SAM-dependent methyltransferase [Thermosulfidibacter takaii]BAT71192.1 conserved hypothetical protein [Thermosulfidibacter takaii ABI70S6]